MLIYFHVFYSIIWILCTLALAVAKVIMFEEAIEVKFLIAFIVLFICSSAMELPRLYIGWSGNLSEKVPKMFGFLIFTFFQFGIQLYLSGWQFVHMPLNILLGIVNLIFLTLEMIFGIITIRHFIRLSGVRFAMYFNRDGTLYQAQEDMNADVIREFELEDASTDTSDINEVRSPHGEEEEIEMDEASESVYL
jgi:hypothetical protein